LNFDENISFSLIDFIETDTFSANHTQNSIAPAGYNQLAWWVLCA